MHTEVFHFGRWLKSAIGGTGKTVAQFIKESGVSKNSLHRWMREAAPKIQEHHRGQIAAALGMSKASIDEAIAAAAQRRPAPPTTSLASVETEKLAAELGRRMRALGTRMVEEIHRASSVEWENVAAQLKRADPRTRLPDALAKLALLPGVLNLLAWELREFSPRAPLDENVDRLVRKNLPHDFEVSLYDLLASMLILESRPGFREARNLSGPWVTRNNEVASRVIKRLPDAISSTYRPAKREKTS